jgi:putative membrane protein
MPVAGSMSLKLVIGVALMACVVLFAVQNATIVELRFLFWTVSLSRALLLIFALAAGFLGGWTLRAWVGWRRQHRAGLPRN